MRNGRKAFVWKHGRVRPSSRELGILHRMDFVANDVISAAKKRAILLSTCGPSTYTTIRSLAAPDKPTDMDYKELLELTMKHYNPQPSVIMQ